MSRGYSGVEALSYASRDLPLERPRRLSLSAALAASAFMTRNVEPLAAAACVSMSKRRCCSIVSLRWVSDSSVNISFAWSTLLLPANLTSFFGGSSFGPGRLARLRWLPLMGQMGLRWLLQMDRQGQEALYL